MLIVTESAQCEMACRCMNGELATVCMEAAVAESSYSTGAGPDSWAPHAAAWLVHPLVWSFYYSGGMRKSNKNPSHYSQ